jgi:ferredoxin
MVDNAVRVNDADNRIVPSGSIGFIGIKHEIAVVEAVKACPNEAINASMVSG